MDAYGALGSDGVAAIASQLGIDEQTAAAGAAALLPALMGGFKQQAQSTGGLDGLSGLLGGLLGGQAAPEQQGNDVLGQIFGSKDVSRAVAANASGASGISPDLLKKMLPIVAMLAAGYFARRSAPASAATETGGGLGGMLGGLLGGLGGQTAAAGAGLGSIGGLASMLDRDGDGNPLNDIMGMVTGKR